MNAPVLEGGELADHLPGVVDIAHQLALDVTGDHPGAVYGAAIWVRARIASFGDAAERRAVCLDSMFPSNTVPPNFRRCWSETPWEFRSLGSCG